MKKLKIFLYCFLILDTQFIFPENNFQNNFGLSFSPYIGIRDGVIDEYLMDSSNEYIISSLEYTFNPLWQFGFLAELNYKNLFFNAKADISLPIKCGNMYDSDYTPIFKMNLCTFDNYDELSINSEIAMYYNFHLSNKFIISPVINLNYFYDSFNCKNGIGYFGDKNLVDQLTETVPWYDPKAVRVRGSSIDYYRYTLLVYSGVKFKFVTDDKFSIIFTAFISPYNYFFSQDQHNDENTNGIAEDYRVYELQTDFFNVYRFVIEAEYKINKMIKTIFIFDYTDCLKISFGETYSDKGTSGSGFGIMGNGPGYTFRSQKSGADFYNIKLQTQIQIKLY